MERRTASQRARALAERLQSAAAALVTVVEAIDDDRWNLVPRPGVWSIGKDAEHVADAAAAHHWSVRLTIGEARPSPRPTIERRHLTTDRSQLEVAAMLRAQSAEGARLLRDLTDAQLDLPTRPPRARHETLAETIGRVVINHYEAHRAEIEVKRR
jgi:uncharacterized damage-inducible protein DinB